MRRLTWLRLWTLVVMLAMCGMACGVPLQDNPQDLEISASPELEAPPSDGALAVTIYLVRDGRLEPVQRSADDTSLPTILALLTQGPTDPEVERGVATALPPQAVDSEQTSAGRVVTISASTDFTSIAGDDQLLAAAQLVWTVTEYQRTARVRITVDGDAIDMLTDLGLTRRPTSRADYESVAPARPGVS